MADHLAIMSKSPPWLTRIAQGQKRVESRWYNQRRCPWQAIKQGDRIFFKNAGGPVTLMATVDTVVFYEHLHQQRIEALLDRYGQDLGILPAEYPFFLRQVCNKQFAIFISLTNVLPVAPFQINKKGFGAMSAWISVENIQSIRIT